MHNDRCFSDAEMVEIKNLNLDGYIDEGERIENGLLLKNINGLECFAICISDHFGRGFCINRKMSKLLYEKNVETNNVELRHLPQIHFIMRYLGDDCHNEFTHLITEWLPLIYKDVYEINEYDGMENIVINRYKKVINFLNSFDEHELMKLSPRDLFDFVITAKNLSRGI